MSRNMIVHNFLDPFVTALHKWEKPPSLAQLTDDYYRHIQPWVEGALWIESARDFRSAIEDLDWGQYRAETLALNPKREESRVKKHLNDIEDLFGFKLEGEIILFGSFAMMDGFARFDRGQHRVYLGADESFAQGTYFDVLTTHELTHAVRESRAPVWEGWGLDPKMSRADFGEYQPVIEHVFGEGFSCTVSELLVPGDPEWHYAYQTRESLQLALKNGAAIDKRIRAEIRKPHAKSDYSRLYDTDGYRAEVPDYPQYVWGWQWTKRLLREFAGGDPRKLVNVCSKDLIESAMSFELRALEPSLTKSR